MSFIMTNINTFMNAGVNFNSFKIAISNWWFAYLTAFLLVYGFVFKIVKFIVDKIANDSCKYKYVIIMPTIMVFFMVPLMSCLLTIYHNNGINKNFLPNVMFRILINYPIAWTVQIFFVGPLVKYIFTRYVVKKTI